MPATEDRTAGHKPMTSVYLCSLWVRHSARGGGWVAGGETTHWQLLGAAGSSWCSKLLRADVVTCLRFLQELGPGGSPG